MGILKATLNHRCAVIASGCFAIGGFALGYLVAKSFFREAPPARLPAQQNATPQVPDRDAEASSAKRDSPLGTQNDGKEGSSQGDSHTATTTAKEVLSALVPANSKDAMSARQAPISVAVLTQYPGMPSELIERDITNRIKRWVSQAAGVRRVEAKSLTDLSLVIVEFENNIDQATAVKQVKSLARSDVFYLPPGTIPPLVFALDPDQKRD